MDGHGVFKFAVRVLAEVAHEALDANDLTAGDVDWLIPHQANVRIMDATAKKLGICRSSASIVTRRPARATRRPRRFRSRSTSPCATAASAPASIVLLLGVGGGFTWGSVLLRW